MTHYQKDQAVRRKWGDNRAVGKVREKFTEHVTMTIKGTDVSRNATDKEPAYLIEQDDGDRVLKSHSEIQKMS